VANLLEAIRSGRRFRLPRLYDGRWLRLPFSREHQLMLGAEQILSEDYIIEGVVEKAVEEVDEEEIVDAKPQKTGKKKSKKKAKKKAGSKKTKKKAKKRPALVDESGEPIIQLSPAELSEAKAIQAAARRKAKKPVRKVRIDGKLMQAGLEPSAPKAEPTLD